MTLVFFCHLCCRILNAHIQKKHIVLIKTKRDSTVIYSCQKNIKPLPILNVMRLWHRRVSTVASTPLRLTVYLWGRCGSTRRLLSPGTRCQSCRGRGPIDQKTFFEDMVIQTVVLDAVDGVVGGVDPLSLVRWC